MGTISLNSFLESKLVEWRGITDNDWRVFGMHEHHIKQHDQYKQKEVI